ncbi:MAG: 2-oxo acid dehydrogenase subunit E2 [Acidobacteria bacterium]|nr:2-oxo acid dehydrogenase subunit E2 [Acidobacteriota bacterium]
MAIEFKIPELGENVTAGDVVRILVKAGDVLTKDQPVLELETDKATIEVPSDVAGTVKDLQVKQGDKVKVGQVVLTLDESAAAPGAAPTAAPKPDATAAPKPEAAAAPESGAPAAPKPTEQPAAAAEEGGLSQRAAAEPQVGEDGAARAEADRGEGKAEQPEAQTAENAPKPKRGEVVDINRGPRPQQALGQQSAGSASPEDAGSAAPAAPSVRRMARELGVDIRSVAGSGEGGRISVEDLHAFVKGVMTGTAVAAHTPAGGGGLAPGQPLPDFTKWGEVERKPMSNIRRKTAEHLGHAWHAIPHVTQHDKADITELEGLRKQYSPQAEKLGGKLTMTAIALKIVAGGLKKFPHFNASIDPGRHEIIYKKSAHIGVAVDTERGLLVPVIRDVDRKGILDLSTELGKASEKARGGKLSLDEMQGGAITITNLGGIGGTSFTPIVNWPEVAILGISRGAIEPVWDGESFEPRMMLPLSLSYDHRVIDGAAAARFLRWVCEAFEEPFVLSL